jgi:hypothetical protein
MMAAQLSIFVLPSFWRGAASARTELMNRYSGETDDVLRYHQAIGAHESIADALGAGKTLDEIPEFASWVASAHQRPKDAPDPLDLLRKTS